MALHHIRLDHAAPTARLSGNTMPRLEFRQALFRTHAPDWHGRLYRAALVVTTVAHGIDGKRLVVDHQAMRFNLLYNKTWPDPVFLDIRSWPYTPVELKEDVPVTAWSIELKLRELRLGEEEWVEVAFLG